MRTIAPLLLFRLVRRAWLLAAWLAVPVVAVRAADRWIVGKSEHFEMFSDANETDSRRILAGLEEFRANFLGVLPLRGASEPRATIVVFNRDSEFRPYKPLYEGKPKSVSGYFLRHSDEVTIAMTSDVPDEDADPREVIYHEYVHLLLDVREAKYPLWLNEGLAEVFSTFTVGDGNAEYGAAKPRHVALLQHVSFLPLPRLFAVTRESPEYNEEDRAGIFYAESWAFTHFLLFGADKGNEGKLGRFAQHLAHGDDVAGSFREVFGLSFNAEQEALRQYLNGGGYHTRGKPAVGRNFPVAFRPAADVERDFALLNLRWRIHHDAAAAAGALALLDRDPTQARPHELLAAIAAEGGDLASAQEHWQRAAERNSDNAWVYLQLLREALGPYRTATMLDVRLPDERVAPWRTWANRALALSPENPEAIEDALTVEALAEKMNLRVANDVQGRVLNLPEPARALLALAVIHWRANNPKSARTLVRLVQAQPRAEMDTRSAANALRYRLPDEAAGKPAAGAPGANGEATVTLQAKRIGDAAKFLDDILAERGTTAVRLTLDAVITRGRVGEPSDVWARADELRKRATAGDPNAMFDLAMAHACGEGVEFSPALATEWLQRAVDHGHALGKADFVPAQIDPNLIVEYLRGQRPTGATSDLPPAEKELKGRITEAAAAADRHAPVVIYRAPAHFPEQLRRAGQNGEALVRFVIRADGHPDRIQAAEYSDPASAAAGEACIRGWRFIPTIRDGQPIGTLAELTIKFEAEKPAKRS